MLGKKFKNYKGLMEESRRKRRTRKPVVFGEAMTLIEKGSSGNTPNIVKIEKTDEYALYNIVVFDEKGELIQDIMQGPKKYIMIQMDCIFNRLVKF